MAYSNDSSGDLNADRRYQYAQELIAEKNYAAAIDLLNQTAELIPQWPPLWFIIGEAHLLRGEKNSAAKAFQKTIELDPTDRLGAGLKIAQIADKKYDAVMSPAYIAALFDQYAHRFDEHLTKALNYKGPEILAEALQLYCSQENHALRFSNVADLGCGTGLMAEKLFEYVDAISGVDLSEKMVTQAQKTNRYIEVICDDVVRYLINKQPHSFDLLIAADVLVYIGDLAPLFNQAAQSMTTGGLFAFTIQSMAGNDYKLGQDMRYHHSRNYIERTAQQAGLKVGFLEECVTRQDAGKPVAGFVIILSRA